MTKSLQGTYTAMVTPFDSDQKVDLAMLSKLIKLQINGQVNGIVPLGTTGEAPTITSLEKKEIISLCKNEVKDQLTLIVGTGSYSTQQTLLNTQEAEDLGADFALIVTPYYNKPTSDGIVKHFQAIAKSTKLPIIVYNIQGRTAKNIDTPTLKRLADIPQIVGVKEASGSVEQMSDVIHTIKEMRPDFCVLSGDDALTLPLIALGGCGVISVVSNLVPDLVQSLVQEALLGHFESARKKHYHLLPLFKGAFLETNPIPIKTAMNLCGIDVGGYRLPLCSMESANLLKLKQILEEMQLL